MEILLLGIEKNFNISNQGVSNSLHLILTIILWGLVSVLLYKSCKKKLDFDVLNTNKIEVKKYIAAIIVMAVFVFGKYLTIGGFKILNEFDDLGIIQWLFQMIYYVFEVMLMFLVIAFGQKFFENLIHKEWIPFGGILLGCTWGLMHILTQGLETGIFALVSAIVYGILYVLFNKNTKVTFMAMFALFVI